MTALQNANGPASVSALPSHGSNIPSEETKMNEHVNSMALETALEVSTVHDVLNIIDLLHVTRHLNEALFLAASGLSDRQHTNAIQAIVDLIDGKLKTASESLATLAENMS